MNGGGLLTSLGTGVVSRTHTPTQTTSCLDDAFAGAYGCLGLGAQHGQHSGMSAQAQAHAAGGSQRRGPEPASASAWLGATDDDPLDVLLPTGVEVGGRRVSRVAAGGWHSAAVTCDGELWVFGKGGDGQLGTGDRSDRWCPSLVVGIGGVGIAPTRNVAGGGEEGWDARAKVSERSSRVIDVACGSFHTVALAACGSVFSWGWCGDGLVLSSAGWMPAACCDSPEEDVVRAGVGGSPRRKLMYARETRALAPILIDLALASASCGENHESTCITQSQSDKALKPAGDLPEKPRDVGARRVGVAVAAGGSCSVVVVSTVAGW